MLENSKINIKIKLAALWSTLMFYYIYADFFDAMTPSSVESFGSLQTPIGPLTPWLLVIFSIILIIPASMIFLSVFLKPKINKWLNIVVAALWSIMSFILLIDTINDDWYKFYALYQVVEIIILSMIVWQAWKWPKKCNRITSLKSTTFKTSLKKKYLSFGCCGQVRSEQTQNKMKNYRNNGAAGALLDEYEKALKELGLVIADLTYEELIAIADSNTEDPDCKSIQTILTHVIRAGYCYMIEIRNSLGEQVDFVEGELLNSVEQYQAGLKKMFNYK